MRFYRGWLVGALALGVVALFPGRASATSIACPATSTVVHGCIWMDVPTSAANASIVPAGNPDAQFVSSGINYFSPPAAFTPAGFLNNPTFTDTSAAFNANGPITNIFVMFTGQVALNAGPNVFSIGHDDGVVLDIAGIAGIEVNQPGPTGFVDTPFTVIAPSAGLYNFTLQFGECCSPPADLRWTFNGQPIGTAPEPASMILLGTGLALGLRRRLTK